MCKAWHLVELAVQPHVTWPFERLLIDERYFFRIIISNNFFSLYPFIRYFVFNANRFYDLNLFTSLKEHINEKNKLNNTNSTDSGAVSGNSNSGLPDLINQKGNKDSKILYLYFNWGFHFIIFQKESTDKARKYLEGLDGVKFNEVQVPETLKKQLEYFDRDVTYYLKTKTLNDFLNDFLN